MIRRVFMAVVLTALLASLGYAQRGGGGGGGGMGGGGGARGGGGQMGRGFQQFDKSQAIANEFKLTPEQKTAMDAIMDQAQTQANPLLPQIVEQKKALLGMASEQRNTDEPTKKLAALNAQVLAVEVDVFTKAVALLDAKQKAKGPRLFELMADMFLAPGGWHKSR
jgi:Spy/CpxP family protein refolding chaperone